MGLTIMLWARCADDSASLRRGKGSGEGKGGLAWARARQGWRQPGPIQYSFASLLQLVFLCSGRAGTNCQLLQLKSSETGIPPTSHQRTWSLRPFLDFVSGAKALRGTWVNR